MIAHTPLDSVRYGDQNYTVQRVSHLVPQSTTQVLVDGQTGKTIVVLKARHQCGATATDLYYGSRLGSGAVTQISQTYPNAANGGMAPSFDGLKEFETGGGNSLVAVTGAGGNTHISIWYIVVDALGTAGVLAFGDMSGSMAGSAPVTGDSSTTQEGEVQLPTGTGSAV